MTADYGLKNNRTIEPLNQELIRKYNVPGPRYTSYPTVPYWDETPPSKAIWRTQVQQTYQKTRQRGISLYIHLPFCESLCTYCGCTTRITVNHRVEAPYIEALLREWKQYRDLLGEPPLIRELHLGGGTPTFFSPLNLRKLILSILQSGQVDEKTELSLEAHPNSTSAQHLQTLYDLGFRRLSLGIQDFGPEVQQIINRRQTYQQVEQVVTLARHIGFTSVNFDLIYGLPKQTIETVQDTIEKTLQIQPDRIAFYSYAHVPWMKPAQRSLEPYLPSSDVKRQLYEQGKQTLQTANYREIGMDHFALDTDALSQASQAGRLHRNFMGYTTQATRLLIGLGASAISDTWTAFGQNAKIVEAYIASTKESLAVQRGHVLTDEDLQLREHILNLMCRGRTQWNRQCAEQEVLQQGVQRLLEMERDGLVKLGEGTILVLPEGKPFVRNVCMSLDARLWRRRPETNLFSSTI
ncbi:oxygen-independent coproporphyrinogen III oxidase [Tunicatimonas pelagia]|uniref:oxygen-independent coproporphyrinogen III oxidase n=1 Tax=Tunicatimonas pelagia TaxID=931531 RepID=UPI002666BA15|nr:oxygen-independent coproporphyrinogen III oxidase [Tunicatimonas pelagia]WKN41133.1 oxygen-independent coproporphyrinogen III oxidase [Tunicatimonas pelagia]